MEADIFRVEEAVGKAELLDMKIELGEVHGDGEEHDVDGGRFWTPVMFSLYAARHHPILAGEDELIMADLLDISAWSGNVGDDGIERDELRPPPSPSRQSPRPRGGGVLGRRAWPPPSPPRWSPWPAAAAVDAVSLSMKLLLPRRAAAAGDGFASKGSSSS